MLNDKNTLLAIVLSAIVLIGWQYFIGMPQMEKAKQEAQLKQQQQTQQQQTQPAPQSGTPAPAQSGAAPQLPGQSGAPTASQQLSREAVIAAGPRIKIENPRVAGSIDLKGGRIDDLALTQYHETIDPHSPAIVLLSPSGSPHPLYAEFGWVGQTGASVKLPDSDTVWTQQGSGSLGVDRPVTMIWDNGQGLLFSRTIAVDDKYLFTIKDTVQNKGTAPVTLYPYSLVSRHGTPETLGYYILHEGLVGVLGKDGLQEYTYKKMDDLKPVDGKKSVQFPGVTDAWFGFTDKYWATTLIPDTQAKLNVEFDTFEQGPKRYQTLAFAEPQTVAPGGSASTGTRLFAGAKEVATVGINFPLAGFDGYNKQLDLNKFDLLIDWGWFYFITKPMFIVIDYLYRLLGNFGLAILAVTVLVKLIFFPLANKSYASMAKMKAVQPEMASIRERFADDKAKQQQALMELYRKEKINPLAGCLPIVIQIPVFFSLYKVLFISIEMRQAPFYGWIHDLSMPDPTNVFNLFGLLAFDPTTLPMFGHFLHVGVWPLIMGVTMWLQMKLNPAQPDPTQQMIFNWMPVIFTFMLANFSAGLVIYWAWNNTLSVTQQSIIMRRHGAKVELWGNIKSQWRSIASLFGFKKDNDQNKKK